MAVFTNGALLERGTHVLVAGYDPGSPDIGIGMFDSDARGRILAYEVMERRGDVWLAGVDFGRRLRLAWR